MEYQTHEEAAEFMFECIYKYISEIFLVDIFPKQMSADEVAMTSHQAYQNSLTSLYIADDDSLQTLDDYLLKSKCCPTNKLIIFQIVSTNKRQLIK